jgi:hypothetical protein
VGDVWDVGPSQAQSRSIPSSECAVANRPEGHEEATSKRRRGQRGPGRNPDAVDPGQFVVCAGVGQQVQADLRRFAAERGVTVSDVIRRGIGLALHGSDEQEGADVPCASP